MGAVEDEVNTVRLADPNGPLPSIHDKPTELLRRVRAQEARTTVMSPIEALRAADIERMRVFFKVVLLLTLSGIVVAAVAQGDAVAQRVVIIASIFSAGAAAWILWVMRDVKKYDVKRLAVASVPVIFGSMAGVYYWGTVSPITGMLVYGIYFFGLGVDRILINWAYSAIAITHAVFAVGIISGLLEDRGLIKMTQLRVVDQLTVLGIIEFLYLVSYATARLSQKATLESVGQLEQAVRAVAHREALLAEARAELERAKVIGGPGRFTEQVVGSYRLGVLLGRGGMGEVYEASHVTDGGEAAVKLLHHGTLGDPMHVERFMREAKAASTLTSPHVVRILEVGSTASEVPYIAMERLRGHDLSFELREKLRMTLADAQGMIAQVASGLEAARASGIVHRDLKPHNVFGVQDGAGRTWKILDFGVSKMGGTGTLTKGQIVGTPSYMAPEQARGEDVDHRADVYALAALAYRAVTGHPAFSGKDVPTMLYEVVYRMPAQPSKLLPLPPDVERVLALGLAKDRDARLATALELADWFGAAVRSALTPAQRRRADEWLAETPWGSRTDEGRER
jgi:hypothetical protein